MKTYRVGGGKTRACCDASLCSGGQTKKGKDARMHINIIFHLTSLFLHLRSFFSDPDLKIEVDLAREEEEKNGRREFSFISKLCL